MRFGLFVSLLLFPFYSFADKCSPQDLSLLKDMSAESDIRGELAVCLVHNFIQNDEVMAQVLKVLRDPNEQLFVREDIVSALAGARWRKKVEIHGSLTPEHISKQEDEALNRTVASAKDILAVTQAVRQMQDTVGTTKYEGEFVRILSEIILNKENHIQLRIASVEAIGQITKIELESGIYEERNIRIAYEALKENANSKDAASYYSGANAALVALRNSPRAELLATMDRPGRSLSSTSH